MKGFRIFFRSIRDAFKSVFRNFSLSIASISCISITLIVVAVSLALSFNVKEFTSDIKSEVTIVVFLNRDTKEEGLKNFESELKKIDNIDSYVFKSKKETQEEMMEENEVFDKIMSSWEDGESPLKDSYLIKVKDLTKIKKTAASIKDIESVEYVDYGEKVSENLVSAFSFVEKVCIIIVLILIVVTVFLIMNTIKLTIYNRKREISIMRLVGASNFTIKTPFVIEGMIIGLIGSIVPIIVTIYGYITLYKNLNGQIFSKLFSLVVPMPFVIKISGIILILGIIVGMLGSARAVRKYLKI